MKNTYKKPNIDSDYARGYRIKLYPTDEQKEILDKQMNLFRFVYNWGLEESQKYYKENGTYIGKDELFRRLSDFRNSTNWMQGIPLHSARLALSHLDFAYKKFFKGEAKFPKFKTKKYSKRCIHYRNEPKAFNFDETSVRLSGFPIGDRILCKSHNVPIGAVYYSCTVTFDKKDYWLSVNIERPPEEPLPEKTGISVGIDLGIRHFAQTSDREEAYQAPSHILGVLYNRYKREQSKLTRMRSRRIEKAAQVRTKLERIPFTKNEKKLQAQHIKTSNRMKNIKKNFLHEVTTDIVKRNPSRIVIEDLNLTDMIHENWSNRDEIFHSMWYKFREIMTYKTKEYGIELVVADRSFPSSQICSRCGTVKKTSSHVFICPNCGLRIDRDVNAAINLSRYQPA